MMFRAILKTSEPQERSVQTFAPTEEQAAKWASAILLGRPQGDSVVIYEQREEHVRTVRALDIVAISAKVA